MYKTPFLIETNYRSFDNYISDLSKKSKYNYKCVIKKYKNIVIFKKLLNGVKYKLIFEKIWGNQYIRGKPINKPNLPHKNNTIYFGCFDKNNNIICLHMIEEYFNYCYSHMPMYDKKKYSELSKFSWFCVIKYIIENMNKAGIDMGGSCGKSISHNCKGNCNPHFKYIVQNRDIFDKYKYKFVYLTKNEKKNPKKYIINNNKLFILK